MKQPRVGSIFIEVCVAVVVIAATLAMVAQLLALALRQQRVIAMQQQATRLAGNLMERIMARPWDELESDRLQRLIAPDELASLPEANVRIEVIPVEQPVSREIRVSVTWTHPPGKPANRSSWSRGGISAKRRHPHDSTDPKQETRPANSHEHGPVCHGLGTGPVARQPEPPESQAVRSGTGPGSPEGYSLQYRAARPAIRGCSIK